MLLCRSKFASQMTLIEALLSLPENGGPTVVSREAAVELGGSSGRFVRCLGILWSLTDDGQRFLTQFRHTPLTVTKVTVRLVTENNVPVFHLLCDDAMELRISRADLQPTLQKIRAANPNVKVTFDFGRPGRVS